MLSTLLLIALGALSGVGSPSPPSPPGHPESAWVIFDADTVFAEVADEPAEHVRGLQGRAEVPAGTGLLFAFEEAEERSFWMVDVEVDLDIAFMDEDFRILRIETMEAGSSRLTDSLHPIRYALEVPAGWFREHGIHVGARPTVVFDPGG